MASRSALRHPIQTLRLPVSRKPDRQPLSAFSGKPDHYNLPSRPLFFSKPSRCPLAAPLTDLPSGPPSHPFTPLRPLSFCKPVRRPSSPPSLSNPRRRSFAAPIGKPAHSEDERLTPPSASEPRGYLQTSSAIQPLTPHSVASPSLGLRRASFSKPGSRAPTPGSSSSIDITDIQKDIPAVSCSLTGSAGYQRLFPIGAT
jgi:hypothetical protein